MERCLRCSRVLSWYADVYFMEKKKIIMAPHPFALNAGSPSVLVACLFCPMRSCSWQLKTLGLWQTFCLSAKWKWEGMEEETACTQSEGCFPSVTSLFIQGTMLVNVATGPEHWCNSYGSVGFHPLCCYAEHWKQQFIFTPIENVPTNNLILPRSINPP